VTASLKQSDQALCDQHTAGAMNRRGRGTHQAIGKTIRADLVRTRALLEPHAGYESIAYRQARQAQAEHASIISYPDRRRARRQPLLRGDGSTANVAAAAHIGGACGVTDGSGGVRLGGILY